MGKRAQTKAFDELLKVCKSILWRAKFTLLIFHLLWHRELWRTHLLTAPNLNRTSLQQKYLRFANTGNLFSRNPKLKSTGTCIIIDSMTGLFTKKKIEPCLMECMPGHFGGMRTCRSLHVANFRLFSCTNNFSS